MTRKKKGRAGAGPVQAWHASGNGGICRRAAIPMVEDKVEGNPKTPAPPCLV